MSTVQAHRAFVGAALFLSITAGCASQKASSKPGPSTSSDRSPYPANVGIQLYSVRNQLKEDLRGTLVKIKEMGLENVELYDLHGMSATQFKALLDEIGLRPRSIHQPFKRLKEDVSGVIADARALGIDLVGCAWIPHQGEYDAAVNDEAIAVFNQAGKAMKEAGIRFFYHPHGYEFRPRAGGSTLFDEMVAKTDPAAVDFQMDVFWFFHGGADPLTYFRKYQDRFTMTHLKDLQKGAPAGDGSGKADKETEVTLGSGQIEIGAIIRETEKSDRIRWHFIEDESSRVLTQVPESLAYLKTLRP